jgi:CubicO group peptidase (beta-lactamase class C family)
MVLTLAALIPTSSLKDDITQALQRIAENKSIEYNCSISIGFKNADFTTAAAAGIVDFSSDRHASVDDSYAWGSGTKPLTGASILKLVSEGAFGLESRVAPLVDPILLRMSEKDPTQTFKSMADLWGADNVAGITIGQMLNMTSGIPDFDTAKGHGSTLTDSLRQELYSNPGKAYTPAELMSVPWVAGKYKPCHDVGPHYHKCYSSTNFMILGLLLANRTGWSDFSQASFLPPSLRTKLHFAVSGAPHDYTPVHGYDRTAYNMPARELNDQDVASVTGVFAGWTASDLVGTASDVAELTWAIYGPSPTVLPKTYSDLMASTALSRDYGLATFNLQRDTGQEGDYGDAYGHLGATYGFQSQLVYFPKLQMALTVATNIETNTQTQPKDALCFAYNTAAGLLLGKQITCTFTKSSYYGSGCKCTPA